MFVVSIVNCSTEKQKKFTFCCWVEQTKRQKNVLIFFLLFSFVGYWMCRDKLFTFINSRLPLKSTTLKLFSIQKKMVNKFVFCVLCFLRSKLKEETKMYSWILGIQEKIETIHQPTLTQQKSETTKKQQKTRKSTCRFFVCFFFCFPKVRLLFICVRVILCSNDWSSDV